MKVGNRQARGGKSFRGSLPRLSPVLQPLPQSQGSLFLLPRAPQKSPCWFSFFPVARHGFIVVTFLPCKHRVPQAQCLLLWLCLPSRCTLLRLREPAAKTPPKPAVASLLLRVTPSNRYLVWPGSQAVSLGLHPSHRISGRRHVQCQAGSA